MSCSPSSTRLKLPLRGSEAASIRSSRYETRCSRCAKVDAESLPTCMRSKRSDSARIAPSRCSLLSAAAGRSRVSSAAVSAAMRCSSTAKLLAVAGRAGDLVDLGRQQLHVVGQTRQRFVGGDVGDDAAQRRDRAFELAHRRRVVIGAQDQIELGAEIADRLVIAGELLGRRQRAQHLLDFGQRVLDARQDLAIGAVRAGLVDATMQRADLVLDRFDRAARHRLGDGVADLGKLAAESVDRLLGIVRTLQRLDLARDLEQMALERREIRPRLRGRRRIGGAGGAIGGAKGAARCNRGRARGGICRGESRRARSAVP